MSVSEYEMTFKDRTFLVFEKCFFTVPTLALKVVRNYKWVYISPFPSIFVKKINFIFFKYPSRIHLLIIPMFWPPKDILFRF